MKTDVKSLSWKLCGKMKGGRRRGFEEALRRGLGLGLGVIMMREGGVECLGHLGWEGFLRGVARALVTA